MRNLRRAAWCAAAMLMAIGGELAAHGISVVVERTGDAWVATARYDGGIPVAGADVVIHGPGAESVYQEGRTDPAGRFVFLPSGPGEWRVRVDDGMGHRGTVRTTVQAADPTPVAAGPAGASLVGSWAGEGMATEGTATEGAATEGVLVEERWGTMGGGGDTGPWRLATGLSLLVGLTGFAYGYSARGRRGSDTT
jgi:nickel transport protein